MSSFTLEDLINRIKGNYKKEKDVPVMYVRRTNLLKMLQALYPTEPSINKITANVMYPYYTCTLDTRFGKRSIVLCSFDAELIYIDSDILNKYKYNYEIHLPNRCIFHIWGEEEVKIAPKYLTVTKDDIDLALLEFETYLYPKFREARKYKRNNEEATEYFNNQRMKDEDNFD